MTTSAAPSRRLFALIVVSVVVGAPLVYLVWEEINELLTGQLVWSHVGIALVALAALLALLRFVAGLVHLTPPTEHP